MSTAIRRLAELWAVAGGLVLLTIVLVTTANAGAFALDRAGGGLGRHGRRAAWL